MSTQIARAALVTGASRGIGRAIALRLVRDEYAIICNFVEGARGAAEVVGEIVVAGGQAATVRADVSDAAQVKHLLDAALDQYDSLDVVVHNAAAMEISLIIEGDLEKFERTISTNLRGAFLVLGQAARHVTTGGRIIALSSSAIGKSFPGFGAYIASKAGIEGLVRVLANELRGRNITVNAVAPGPVATDALLNAKRRDELDFPASTSPLERLGEEGEIAGVASFLAGHDGRRVNGQVLRANGGFI